MSKAPIDVDKYLQFTPLTSAASARGLIESFAPPKVNLEFLDLRERDEAAAESVLPSDEFLSQVLRRAIEAKDHLEPT